MGFGKTVRKLRLERDMTIAELARRAGMSPTYLAPIEREVFPPPVEAKIVRLAKILDRDPDEFLAQAGKVAPDLLRILRRRPRAIAGLLRAVAKHSESDLDELSAVAKRKRKRATRKRK